MSPPRKRILLQNDLELWKASDTHNEFVDFVLDLQNSVVGLTNDAPVAQSDFTDNLRKALDQIDALIDSHPVVKDKEISRFGKPEFRDFYDAVQTQVGEICVSLLTTAPEKPSESHINEIKSFLGESWGNRTRIDYGSGHELNFMCFLFCLRKLNAFQPSEYSLVILSGFTRYIEVMRKLQRIYWLEPAGSHGVWGLDDYHFLPFLFGSAQLATHPHMKPKLIHNRELVETIWKKYMYLECIHFINSIKIIPGKQSSEVSLRWHSPMLDDILSAKSWAKIKEGMVKMYKAEVLSKLPIVQHLHFGELFPAPDGLEEHLETEDDCGHVHSVAVNTWGDCCGIKIPSAIAATQMNEKSRPLPFD